MKRFPRHGHEADEVLRVMADLRGGDVRWRDGRVWSLVFHPGDELAELSKRAYIEFFAENALNPSAFPSLRRMEAEVVSMTASLLGGDADVAGNMTTGGTESILMAVKAAREWGRTHRPKVTRPEMVLPRSAHPAFAKAAHYFDVKPVTTPQGADFRADVKAVARAVNERTVLLVGSAPSYPQGVVDPISEIARLAEKEGILCHVDACVGGLMLPFVRDLGHHVPDFDFGVPGVTSISVDLHKYGYAAKGASVVLYRNAGLRRFQYFAHTDWPGGIYASPTMTGTRPGGAIASAWALFHRLGFEGYLEIARQVMDTTRKLRLGIESIDGLEVLGEPHMSVLAIASRTHDIYEVADQMTERHWHLDRQQHPPSLHLTVTRSHVQSADRFIRDLRESARITAREPMDRLLNRTKYVLLGAAARVLPKTLVSKVTSFASEKLGIGEGSLPTRTAAMYGMMASLPNRGDIQEFVIDALDGMTRYDPVAGEILPDLPGGESEPEPSSPEQGSGEPAVADGAAETGAVAEEGGEPEDFQQHQR
jgi:glutamate/tyrosine decarboxylase-like PLP-dependent enzyme